MTEHSDVSRPNERPNDRNSLLERASRSFGLEGLTAAPVPVQLPSAQAKRTSPSPVPKQEPAPQFAVPKISEAYVPAHPERQLRPEPVLTVPNSASPDTASVSGEARAIILGGDPRRVDRDLLRSQSLIVPEDPVTELLEEFRIIKRQLIAAAHQTGTAAARRILICSPHSGEGKTFCSSNLAIAMAAERGCEVLLVDADFAKPSLLSTFGLPAGPGLMDALADPHTALDSLPIRTDIPNLWILPAGNYSRNDSEHIASSRTGEILDRFTVGAPDRILIFDTPPALAASPAAELAKHVGQAVLVARADFTGHSALEDAYHLLSGCPDIKLLLNATQFSPSGRRFGTYYGYGE